MLATLLVLALGAGPAVPPPVTPGAQAQPPTPAPAVPTPPVPAPPVADPRGSNVVPGADAEDLTRAIQPFRYYEVEIDDNFWAPIKRISRRATLRHLWTESERTGRLANFRRAAGAEPGGHQGFVFNDSDVYKLMEGTAYALRETSDDFTELQLQDLAKLVAKAQRPDGYINTFYQLGDLTQRWTDLANQHELYSLGHLIEAGVAAWESKGDRTLLDVAKRAAAHIRSQFGPGKRREVCGHPEIELALLRLHEVTGDPADLALAQWFIDERGHPDGRPSAGAYAQDAVPIREQQEVTGHAVRAGYLYAAATRLARIGGDDALAAAMRRLFDDVTTGKMYVTGGIGSSRSNEGFTTAFDLPNADGYAETCAAIALVLWAHEMSLLERDARPIDVLERALYNAVLSGMSQDGTRFFYDNPPGSAADGKGGRHRQGWFDCACCPPNIFRLLGRMGDFIAARDGRTVFINLYVQGTVATTFERASVRITQRTEYPWDGAVKLWVTATRPADFTLALRIPSWCEGATIKVDGQLVEPRMERGYALLTRNWDGNNQVELTLPMPVKVLAPDPRVAAQKGRFALQRGPLVYAVEALDAGGDLAGLSFDPKGPFQVVRRDDLLGGITTITGSARRGDAAVPFTAIPFFAWDNRGGTGGMEVWLPEEAPTTPSPPTPNP